MGPPDQAPRRRTLLHRHRAAEPHRHAPEEAERLGRIPADAAFVTGNGLAGRCRFVLNYGDFTVDEQAETDWYFCKVDYLDWFFERHAPKTPFVLVSHNGDYSIDSRYRRELGRRNLTRWFATNVELRHPKLVPIPIGIANPGWEHGDQDALREAQRSSGRKTQLFDVSFAPETNAEERRRCLEHTGLELAPRLPHRAYLERLASACFCLSPSGNGIDTHRTWEALYLRAIPVVTRSALTDEYVDLPLVVLDDWADFSSVEFSRELYERLLGSWDPSSLGLEALVERMRRRVPAG